MEVALVGIKIFHLLPPVAWEPAPKRGIQGGSGLKDDLSLKEDFNQLFETCKFNTSNHFYLNPLVTLPPLPPEPPIGG